MPARQQADRAGRGTGMADDVGHGLPQRHGEDGITGRGDAFERTGHRAFYARRLQGRAGMPQFMDQGCVRHARQRRTQFRQSLPGNGGDIAHFFRRTGVIMRRKPRGQICLQRDKGKRPAQQVMNVTGNALTLGRAAEQAHLVLRGQKRAVLVLQHGRADAPRPHAQPHDGGGQPVGPEFVCNPDKPDDQQQEGDDRDRRQHDRPGQTRQCAGIDNEDFPSPVERADHERSKQHRAAIQAGRKGAGRHGFPHPTQEQRRDRQDTDPAYDKILPGMGHHTHGSV